MSDLVPLLVSCAITAAASVGGSVLFYRGEVKEFRAQREEAARMIDFRLKALENAQQRMEQTLNSIARKVGAAHRYNDPSQVPVETG